MDRRRIPSHKRRYSLPTTSVTPLGYSRTVPEGSDTFQKALEELYTDEPNHAPSRQEDVGCGLNGLNNIMEGNESDYIESEEEVDESELLKISRRHSSPSCFVKNDSDDEDSTKINDRRSSMKKANQTAVKSQANFRKEYFVKHGYWPALNNNPAQITRPSSYRETKTKSGVAFGSGGTAAARNRMTKLRV